MYISENGLVSNRRTDAEREKNMQDSLNEIYRNHGITTIRVEDREQQLKGIDLLMKNGDDWIKVDEKAATTKPTAYTSLLTFCFEISSDNNPDSFGWLFKPDSETTHYAIIFPLSSDNFETLDEAEIMIIRKQSILDLLWDFGIGSKRDAVEIIKNSDHYDDLGRKYYWLNDVCKLAHSLQLPEQPLNVIVDRGVLRRMAAKVINYQRPA